MTAYIVEQGRSLTLSVEWLQYPGGPASPVTGVTVEIAPVGGGASAVGPTSTGVSNPAVGLDFFTWQVPSGQAVGDYVAIWRGADGDGDQVQATDTLTVTAGSAAAISLITVADAKAQLNIPADDTSQDAELGIYIEAATEVIEQTTGPVVPRTVTEVHDGGQAVLVLRHPPALSITSVTEAGVLLPADTYTADAGVLYRASGRWPCGARAITVVYQAGRSPIPAAIRLAAKELVQVNYRPQLGGDYSPFDTDSREEGIPGEVRLGFFVPNRVRDMLAPHDQYAGIA